VATNSDTPLGHHGRMHPTYPPGPLRQRLINLPLPGIGPLEWDMSPENFGRLHARDAECSTVTALWHCPVCDTTVHRSKRSGRHRVYCTNSCKQKAYRYRRVQKRSVTMQDHREPRPDRAATYDRAHAIRPFHDLSSRRRDSIGRGVTACGAFARMSIDTPDRFAHCRFVAAEPIKPTTCRRCAELTGLASSTPGDPSPRSRGTAR